MTREEAAEKLKDHEMYLDVSECDMCGFHRNLECGCGYETEGTSGATDDITNHVLDVLFGTVEK